MLPAVILLGIPFRKLLILTWIKQLYIDAFLVQVLYDSLAVLLLIQEMISNEASHHLYDDLTHPQVISSEYFSHNITVG